MRPYIDLKKRVIVGRDFIFVKTDRTGKKHCLTGPAVKFNTGEEQYWVDGIFCPDKSFYDEMVAMYWLASCC